MKIEASRTSEEYKTLPIFTWCKDSREDSAPTVNQRKSPKLIVHSFPDRSFVIMVIINLEFRSVQREVYCCKSEKQHPYKSGTKERESQKERDHWEDRDVGGWTILRWILER
jgi:hypothetical protein